MSFFAGCDFFMVLFILLIPAVLLGLSEKKLKWYRWLLSLFFIWEVYGSTKIQLLYLIGYVIFAAYLVKIYLYLRKKYGRNKYIYGHAVFLSLLPLLVYKIGGLRGYSVFGFLGISYICFKIIQVVIECYDGVINEIDEFQFIEIIYVFLTIFLYLLKCPQSLILSALRAFFFCGKPHISRSIFLYFLYQTWLKSW